MLFEFSVPAFFSVICVVRGEPDEEESYLVLKNNFKATPLQELCDVNSGPARTIEAVPIN